ncbi:MAG: hypothetical protein JKP98_14295 [Rhodobacteraceae bacterium]|nr:hypothetical protein [Paracoccaceae bacterium]
MTGAAAIGPLPRLITEHAGDRAVDRAFKSAGLTLSAIASPRTPIPLRGLAQLWESGAVSAAIGALAIPAGWA